MQAGRSQEAGLPDKGYLRHPLQKCVFMQILKSVQSTAALLLLTLAALPAVWMPGPLAAQQDPESALWDALKDGRHLLLMRHALAPGVGDPPGFALGACDSQRNLSDTGRQQSRDIGKRLRANGIHSARVYSSQWCRCLDTAELLGLGEVRELEPLNSFFRDPGRRDERTDALKAWIRQQDLTTPLVLVTHQVNISALAGSFAGSGEMIVMRRDADGGLSMAGSIRQR